MNNKEYSKNLLIGISPNSKLFKEYKYSSTSLFTIQREASTGLNLGDMLLVYKLPSKWR